MNVATRFPRKVMPYPSREIKEEGGVALSGDNTKSFVAKTCDVPNAKLC